MRFLLLTQYFPPETGAAQTRLAAMSHELRRQGHEVEVVTCMPNYPLGKVFEGYGGFYSKHIIDGMAVHRFAVSASQGKTWQRLWNYLSFMLSSMCGIFVTKKPDVIFVNSGPLFLAIPGWIYAKWWRVPMILNVSDLWPRSVEHLGGLGGKLFLKVGLRLEAWAYKRATVVNAITDGVRDILINEKKVPPAKVLFLPNGVDTDMFAPRDEKDPQVLAFREKLGLKDKFVFVYPGNHGYAHALGTVLQAAALLQKSHPLIHFLLVGGGSEKPALLEEARRLELMNVTFHDPVPPNELGEYLAAANAGLIHLRDSPLAQETRPAKMFPLMSQGLPILYAGTGEGANLLKLAGGGISIPSQNAPLLAETAARFLTAETADWGRKNREYVQNHLSWFHIVQHWLAGLRIRP